MQYYAVQPNKVSCCGHWRAVQRNARSCHWSDIAEAEAVWQYACASHAAVEAIVRSALKPADMAPILQIPAASAHNIVFCDEGGDRAPPGLIVEVSFVASESDVGCKQA